MFDCLWREAQMLLEQVQQPKVHPWHVQPPCTRVLVYRCSQSVDAVLHLCGELTEECTGRFRGDDAVRKIFIAVPCSVLQPTVHVRV